MPIPQDKFEDAIALLGQQFRQQLDIQARVVRTTPDALLKAVVADLLGEEHRADGRALEWLVRLRLYDCGVSSNEPVADSDDKLEDHLPGTTKHRGLPAVAAWIVELASDYHGAPCAGLDRATLRRKLSSLRTMLSNRNDGTGVLRANYQVLQYGVTRHMAVRCDVVRADRVVAEVARKMPSIARAEAGRSLNFGDERKLLAPEREAQPPKLGNERKMPAVVPHNRKN